MTDEPERFLDLLQPALNMITPPAERAEVIRTRYDEERQPISPFTRAIVMRRDKYRCVWCGERHALELDHIVPWSAGGSDDAENLRVLCHVCNTRRSNFVSNSDIPGLPLGDECVLCNPDACPDYDVQIIYCTTCNSRARGVPDSVNQPDQFGIRYHP